MSEIIEKRILNYKGEELEVVNVFQHSRRKYITIDVLDQNKNPYTICDFNDDLYEKIRKIKVSM